MYNDLNLGYPAFCVGEDRSALTLHQSWTVALVERVVEKQGYVAASGRAVPR